MIFYLRTLMPLFFVAQSLQVIFIVIRLIHGKKYYISIIFSFFIVLIILILLQPDLGMTILISATFFCQLFVAGLSMFLVTVAIFFLIAVFTLSYFLLDHVQKRISSFLGGSDTYQIDLSLEAFKSGGIFGKGPGQGILKDNKAGKSDIIDLVSLVGIEGEESIKLSRNTQAVQNIINPPAETNQTIAAIDNVKDTKLI